MTKQVQPVGGVVASESVHLQRSGVRLEQGASSSTRRRSVGAVSSRQQRKEQLIRTRMARKGRPSRLVEVKASERITARQAACKASGRLNTGSMTGSVRRMGVAKTRDAAISQVQQTDMDESTRFAHSVRDIAQHSGKQAAAHTVRGVSSTMSFMWRHRHAPKQVVAAGVQGVKASVLAARQAGVMIRTVAAAVSSVGGCVASLPLLPVFAAVLAAICVVTSMFSFLFSVAASNQTISNVPTEYMEDVLRAGAICPVVTPSVIAAQIESESNWNPNATSTAGAQGIAQFMPMTWASVGKDGDGDGKADIMNPHDAILTQGHYMCALVAQVESAKTAGSMSGDTLRLALAAYNAGFGSVQKYGGVPPFVETMTYVEKIVNLASAKYATILDAAGQVGELSPKLTVADGIVSLVGIDRSPGSTYAHGQCTWWAAIRRAQIGKPVDGYMGNGGDWGAYARVLGYAVGSAPRPGDVISFGRGVLDADATYGHVAIVEQVREDGSILISEANVRGVGVVSTRSITSSQLAAAGDGVTFIH